MYVSGQYLLKMTLCWILNFLLHLCVCAFMDVQGQLMKVGFLLQKRIFRYETLAANTFTY